MKQSYVYIMASAKNTLYIGVTSNLEKRVYEHKNKLIKGFTRKYNINRLIYFEESGDIMSAIAREKQLKGWTRAKKEKLINTLNPSWRDLSLDWY